MLPKKTSFHSEESLSEAIRQGGRTGHNAENQLFNQFSYFIREGVKKYNLDEERTFDAYSDAVLNVIEQIREQKFEGRSSIKTYLFQVFSNKCVDISRRNTTKKSSVHHGIDISDFTHSLREESTNILQQLIEQSDRQKLSGLLDKMGGKCREILLLWGDGFTDKDIAAELEFNSAEVAKTSRARCLKKLRELYQT